MRSLLSVFQRLGLVWGLFAFGLLGCGTSSDQVASSDNGGTSRSAIQAVATVGMVADIVRHVGGEHVEVTQMMGSGVDPHLYKPTRDDVQTILRGEIVFYSGLLLEGKMQDTLEKVSSSKPVVAVTDAIAQDALLAPQEFAGHADPHVWMDVELWSRAVGAVEEALVELAPQHAEEFRQRADAYRQQLAQLHAYGKKVIGSIPESRRILITSHDAFNYLGRAYGLEVIGVQGLSTDSEAGLQHINALVDLIVEKKITAVFVESSVSEKNIVALIDGAASRGHQVVIGGELYSDAMGEQGTYEGTYIGMLDHNLTSIARGLGGEAPERGFSGKLSE